MNRIIVYTPTPMPGGMINSSKMLAEGFSRKGYDVIFVANREGKVKPWDEVIYLNANDFTRPFKLKKIIEDLRPVAVFSNMFTQNVSLSLSRLLVGEEVRKSTKFIGISRNGSSRLRRGQWYKLPYRFFIKKVYENLDWVVAVSSVVKRDIMETFFVREEKIKVIHNPFDLEMIRMKADQPIEDNLSYIFSNYRVLINTSRFSEQKRLDLLIRAFRRIRDRFSDVKLMLVGEGEEEEFLKDLTRSLGLERDVIFLPFTDNPFKYMKRSYLFILTSRDEGFGRVLVESFYVGTPVVAYYNEYSGVVDIIDNGKNGFLVPFGNEDELVRKISYLLENPRLREEFSREGVRKAQEFALERILSKYEELIG